MKGVTIDEEWIYNCIDSAKLKEALESLRKDSSRHGLVQIGEKRLKLLIVGPSEAEKRKAEELRLKGNDHVKVTDYKTAMNFYTESIKVNPTEAGTFGNRALTYQKVNDAKRAIQDAKTAILLNKDFARGYQRLAEGYMLDRKYERAYVALKVLLKKDPTSKPGNTLMADLRKTMLENGINVHEANADKEALELAAGKFADENTFEPMEDVKAPTDPSNTSEIEKYFGPYNRIREEAREYHKSGKFDLAIDLYKKALELIERMEKNPGAVPKEEFQRREAVLYSNMAVCYKQKQEPTEVIGYSSRTIDSPAATPDMKLKAYILRAYAYESIDKIKLAKADWISVKELQPGNIDASRALGRISSALFEDEAQKKLDSIGEAVRGLEESKKRGNEYYKASMCFV